MKLARLTTILTLALTLTAFVGCAQHEPLTIRVLTYNIHHAEGLDDQTDLGRIARVIVDSNADLVALQEVDRGIPRTDNIDQPTELGRLTGMHAVFEKNAEIQGGDYGNAVLSRWPIKAHANHHLPQPTPGEQRGLLEIHVEADDAGDLVFFATHFDHRRKDAERLASIAVLQDLTSQLLDVNPQTILIAAGDLNATPDSPVLDNARAFATDAATAAVSTAPDPELTFPADAPDRRIDYILFKPNPRLRCVGVQVLNEPVASDHRPVLATFELERK